MNTTKKINIILNLFNKNLILVFIFLLSFQFVFSQEDDNVEIITHKVALGETMLMISKKYLVQPSEIYKLNKKANDGVSEGMILYIPQPIKSQDIIAKKKEKREKEKLALLERKKEREEREERELAAAVEKEKESSILAVVDEKENQSGRREEIGKLKISDKKQFIEHEVVSGETLNGLSRKYGISVEEIQKENEKVLKNGLQVGQTLKIPVAQNLFIEKEPKQVISSILPNNSNINTHNEITHEVISGETLFSISRKYEVSVAEINNQNESLLKNGLQAGQILKIKSNKSLKANDQKNESFSSNNSITESTSLDEYTIVKHKVEPKETLYSISRKYGVSVDEIKNENENILSKGLQAGQEISIRVKK